MTRSSAQRAQLEQARTNAAAWHQSPEGQAWHSAHSKQLWENARYVTVTCTFCDNEFSAPVMAGNAKFCSERCRYQVRDSDHRRDERVPCPVCGELFWRNRYTHRPATCSRVCGWANRRPPKPVEMDLAQADPPSSAAVKRGQRLAERRRARR
jgi:endogenous inhibitor of DNA gyrase (YacG/DUF329 family)